MTDWEKYYQGRGHEVGKKREPMTNNEKEAELIVFDHGHGCKYPKTLEAAITIAFDKRDKLKARAIKAEADDWREHGK